MKIGILSDIHGNIDALDAVLEIASKRAVERLILLGDYVGYYYEPLAVIERLMDWNHIAIQGNHDRIILEARDNPEVRDAYRRKYGTSVDVTLETLGDREWGWLENLPKRTNTSIGSAQVELCHGGPQDQDAYIYPDAGKSIFDELAMPNRDAIWMGHTHWPFLKPGQPWLLNPGSVGQSRDIGGMASWCIYDDRTQSTSFQRTEYDISNLLSQISARDPNLPTIKNVLSRGRLNSEKAI